MIIGGGDRSLTTCLSFGWEDWLELIKTFDANMLDLITSFLFIVLLMWEVLSVTFGAWKVVV
ncbi:hypothetical protein [Candidatus Hodgkinia cicadicola]|uniref:hypothetical protein n=1 Tax=Candidatus Hodgkinia cicadicola TaxID=573658 RepID=UPI001788C03A